MRALTFAAAAASVTLVAACGSLPRNPATTQPPSAVNASQTPSGTAASPASPAPHSPSERPTHTAPAPRLIRVHDPGEVTGSLAGPCRARGGGQLPDPRCTPGAYDPAITTSVLCSPGYTTGSYRPPESQTEKFKFDQAYPAYGIPADTRSELDHLVPLELGGANDAANLWPEAGSVPNPKDAVESALHDAVCSGQVTLAAAQQAIASDWMTAEARLGVS
jgi:hypothetical protein